MDQEAGALTGASTLEVRALQCVVAIAGLVPVAAGAAGALEPLDLYDPPLPGPSSA